MMSARGRCFLVFALLSIACGRASKEASAPAGQPGAEMQDDQESATPSPAPAATPAEEAPSSASKEKDENRELTLSEAVSEFDRARIELSQLLGRELGQAPEPTAPSAGASAPAREPPRSRAPADKAASRAEGEDSKAKPLKKGDDGCVNVCRAFESLTRSAAAVCRLDEGDRCKKANTVVAVAQGDAGVKACACKL